MIAFQIRDKGQFRFVFFKLADGADPTVVGRKIDEVKERFNGSFTIIFRGAGPCWLYAMLTHAAHATDAVACFQPRLGYVVVTSHAGVLKAGQILQPSDIGLEMEGDRIVGGEEVKLHRQLVVAVGGPPHSGKSVFLNELYQQLRSEMSSDVFLLRACPDGEGMWMYDCAPEVAQRVRAKGKFGEQFTDSVAGAIANLRKGFRIVLVDLGGKLLPPNDLVLAESTHQIVLSSDEGETKKWVQFGEQFGAETLAVLESELVRAADGQLDPSARS
ncbi:MAG: CRISPR-associated ring nuclease Crn3/Csx3, partial [bacterium]|nr:CRISPR-associated ring nuclease Crn3/Csx3 [bacterium]